MVLTLINGLLSRLCSTGVVSYKRRPIRYREMVLTVINGTLIEWTLINRLLTVGPESAITNRRAEHPRRRPGPRHSSLGPGGSCNQRHHWRRNFWTAGYSLRLNRHL